MKFRDWILLNEIQHFSFPTTLVNGITTDGIDFRFEDWGKGYNPAKHDVIKMAPKGNPYFSGPFSVPLSNGTFLNVSFVEEPYTSRFGGGVLSMRQINKINVEPQATERILPRQWYDFAIFYLRGKVVKPPEWPRSDSEQGIVGKVE